MSLPSRNALRVKSEGKRYGDSKHPSSLDNSSQSEIWSSISSLSSQNLPIMSARAKRHSNLMEKSGASNPFEAMQCRRTLASGVSMASSQGHSPFRHILFHSLADKPRPSGCYIAFSLHYRLFISFSIAEVVEYIRKYIIGRDAFEHSRAGFHFFGCQSRVNTH